MRLPKMDYNAQNSVEEAQDEWVIDRQGVRVENPLAQFIVKGNSPGRVHHFSCDTHNLHYSNNALNMTKAVS